MVIQEVPRYGLVSLMERFGPASERWRVGPSVRLLNLADEAADPVVGALKLREAQRRLRDGLAQLPELARALEERPPRATVPAFAEPTWSLFLDQEEGRCSFQ